MRDCPVCGCPPHNGMNGLCMNPECAREYVRARRKDRDDEPDFWAEEKDRRMSGYYEEEP